MSLTQRKVLHNQQAASERTEEVKVSCNTGGRTGSEMEPLEQHRAEDEEDEQQRGINLSIKESKAKGQSRAHHNAGPQNTEP